METIKIGALEWTTKNLDLLEMQDGSTLTVAKSFKEWIDLCNSEKPCLNDLGSKTGIASPLLKVVVVRLELAQI